MRDRTTSRRRLLRSAAGLATAASAGCFAVGGGETETGSGGGTPADGGRGPTATTTGAGGSTTTPTAGEPGALALRTVATGFRAPLDVAVAPGTDTPYVADQTGVVSSVADDGRPSPFLDLRDRVVTGGERGLLGMAFHPAYADNRLLYVRYSAPRLPGTPSNYDHTFVLAEFRASADGSRVDPATERVLLTVPEPQSNHNAGSIAFGPDGYLYVGVGDGGGGGDVGTGHVDDRYAANPGGNGQDVEANLLGSILRIDVDEPRSSASRTGSDAGDQTSGDRPYGIPGDNPLVGRPGLDEHFAWGFRNPWRFSFDGEKLYVGDVGQSAYEEVDVVVKGGNYGWNVREGTHCYGASGCPTRTPDGQPLRDPIVEYPHGGGPVSGVSVIGGYVVRGDSLPGLAGRYVFGDLAADGRLFVATPPDGDGRWTTRVLPLVDADRRKLSRLLSFGRDDRGRLYALGTGDGGGGVYELRPGE